MDEPLLIDVLDARDLMGEAYAELGDWPGCVDQYRTLLAMRPGNAESREHLAHALFAEHD